jgi:hypothetical protein
MIVSYGVWHRYSFDYDLSKHQVKLEAIANFCHFYESLNEAAKQWCRMRLLPHQAALFLLHSNQMEQIGTQSSQDTKLIITKYHEAQT